MFGGITLVRWWFQKKKWGGLLFFKRCAFIFAWDKMTAQIIYTSRHKGKWKQRETETRGVQHWWAEGSDWRERYWRHLRVIAPWGGESHDEDAGEAFCSMEKYLFFKAALYTLSDLVCVALSPLSSMMHMKSVITWLFHRYDFPSLLPRCCYLYWKLGCYII